MSKIPSTTTSRTTRRQARIERTERTTRTWHRFDAHAVRAQAPRWW